MALTKVTHTDLLAIVSVASNAVHVGGALDVSAYYGADVRIRMGRGTATAFTTAPVVRLEGSYTASPTADEWVVLAQFQCALGATVASTAVSGTEAAGQTVVTLTSGTNFTSGDYIFFHNTTIGNSEWARIVSVATNDITLEEGLVAAQTGATARDQAEQFHALLDLTSFQRLRAVIDARASGQASVWEVDLGGVTGL